MTVRLLPEMKRCSRLGGGLVLGLGRVSWIIDVLGGPGLFRQTRCGRLDVHPLSMSGFCLALEHDCWSVTQISVQSGIWKAIPSPLKYALRGRIEGSELLGLSD